MSNFNYLKNKIFGMDYKLGKDIYYKSLRDIEFEQFDFLSPDKQLAIYLHQVLCNHDIDRCFYHYEEKDGNIDWNGYEHKKYLEKSRKILSLTNNFKLIINLIEILK